MGFFDFFPYTNFHNVNLDWVLQRVKEWGELVEANNTAFHELKEANASFKEYVESYLENLDIQDEIDDKLDRMFESGVLGEYLQPYVSPVVTTWLDENITDPEGVVIDSSLTVSGACADSAAVGERLRPVEYTGDDDFKVALINCLERMVFIDTTGEHLITELKTAMKMAEIYIFPENASIIHGRVQKTSSDNNIAILNTSAPTGATFASSISAQNTSNIPFYNIYPLKQGNCNKLLVTAEYDTNYILFSGYVQLSIVNGTYFVNRLSGRVELNEITNINPDDGDNYLIVKFESTVAPETIITSATVKLMKG